MPAGVESCGTLTGQKPGRLDWVPAGRESVEPKQQPSPAWACPPWYAGQAGRWHGPCPDARKRRRGHIHPPSRKADMHAARRYRVPRDAEYATPHTGLTSCARTRSRLRLRRTAKTPPDGSDGPTPSGGILALQSGEDVNEVRIGRLRSDNSDGRSERHARCRTQVSNSALHIETSRNKQPDISSSSNNHTLLR